MLSNNTKSTISIMAGTCMYRNSCQVLAPSTFADSRMSAGTD